ncbi:hypothetical protein FQZ97_1242320 [compost metagenome]
MVQFIARRKVKGFQIQGHGYISGFESRAAYRELHFPELHIFTGPPGQGGHYIHLLYQEVI